MEDADIMQMVSQVWLRVKRCQWIFSSTLHVFVETNFMLENSIWTASCAIPIIYPQKDGKPDADSRTQSLALGLRMLGLRTPGLRILGLWTPGCLDPGCCKKLKHSTRSSPRNSGNWQNLQKITISFLRW